MQTIDFRYGFRIVGDCHNERRLVDAEAAFVAHCECDARAALERESYLSAFCFGHDFRQLLAATGSAKGFAGPTWARWLWFDIDRDDLAAARVDCQKLVATVLDRFAIADDELLILFSGRKGFHVGLPTVLWSAEPGRDFHLQSRRFAEGIAASANVAIDSGVYDRVRALRAPNSKHPHTGRHKRLVRLDGLMRLSADRIVELAAEPWPFELPTAPKSCPKAIADWQQAGETVEQERLAATERRQSGIGSRVTRATLAFIRDGASKGNRHPALFSAAANLAEFGCSFELAFGLLSEAALDTGLTPSDVRRQIERGLDQGRESH